MGVTASCNTNNCNSDVLVSCNTDNKSKIINSVQYLMVSGYIRGLKIDNIPLSLIFICYEFQFISEQNKIFFNWKQQIKPNNYCVDFMKNYIECQYLNPTQTTPIQTSIAIVNRLRHMNMAKQSNHQISATCYVPNSIMVNKLIQDKSEFKSQCEQLNISNPSAIITIETSNKTYSNKPSLKDTNNNDCSAVIFDETYLSDRNTHNLYAFEMTLPTFLNGCDDMIYCQYKQSIIGYQSFYAKYNKLYCLNNACDWQLLTKINWNKSYSAATMINIEDKQKVFISTIKGESVLLNLRHNKWERLPECPYTQNDVSSFENEFVLPEKPIFCYNKFYQQMYRVCHSSCDIDNYKNYYFDFQKDLWIQINLINKFNCARSKIINQSIWTNTNQSPNILYTMVNVVYNKKSKRQQSQNTNNILGFYDQRDYTHKQWQLVN